MQRRMRRGGEKEGRRRKKERISPRKRAVMLVFGGCG